MDHAVRCAVIGFGGMGSQYVEMLHKKEVDGMVLAGICCRNAAGQERIRACYPEAAIYRDVEDTFAHRSDFDAVAIVTPHATHVEIGKLAARAGKHILVDKPIGISTKEARELIREAEENHVSLSMIFNTRMNRAYGKAKEMIDSGELGTLSRVVWVGNTWYRTPAYHLSAPWRSTWGGEHGGLLINQCGHFLDVWQWLFGMPDAVYASLEYGKYGVIHVDDSVMLQLFYDNGLLGTFVSSSGDYPGVNRLEVWGTKGRLTVEDSRRLTFDENVVSTDEFAKTNREIYGKPEHCLREIEVEDTSSRTYQILFQNFTDHLLKGTPLYTDGYDGLRTVMIANGAYLSSWLEKRIAFPIDDELYASMLEEKIRSEKG